MRACVRTEALFSHKSSVILKCDTEIKMIDLQLVHRRQHVRIVVVVVVVVRRKRGVVDAFSAGYCRRRGVDGVTDRTRTRAGGQATGWAGSGHGQADAVVTE